HEHASADLAGAVGRQARAGALDRQALAKGLGLMLRVRGNAGGGVSPPPLRVWLAILLAAALSAPPDARGGHELPFYPSFYPQEIRIDSIEPTAAAPLVAKSAMQAYVGGDPFASGKLP